MKSKVSPIEVDDYVVEFDGIELKPKMIISSTDYGCFSHVHQYKIRGCT